MWGQMGLVCPVLVARWEEIRVMRTLNHELFFASTENAQILTERWRPTTTRSVLTAFSGANQISRTPPASKLRTYRIRVHPAQAGHPSQWSPFWGGLAQCHRATVGGAGADASEERRSAVDVRRR